MKIVLIDLKIFLKDIAVDLYEPTLLIRNFYKS